MRTHVLIWFSCCALTLAAACGDDDDSTGDGSKHDSGAQVADGGGAGHHDGGGGDGGSATKDAASGSGGGGAGGHDHGGSGDSGARDSGGGSADDDAGGLSGSGGADAGTTDSGSGGTSAGTGGSGSCDVTCGSDCCNASEECGTEPPKTVSAGWGFGAGSSVLHVVQGSTVTFGNLGPHNINQFANETAFTNCDFTGLAPLATSGTYSWIADTLGDFYFGCSINTHCVTNNVKKHVVVEAAGPACVPK